MWLRDPRKGTSRPTTPLFFFKVFVLFIFFFLVAIKDIRPDSCSVKVNHILKNSLLKGFFLVKEEESGPWLRFLIRRILGRTRLFPLYEWP